MQTWIDDLARSLGEEPLTREEVAALLDAARDVAHRVERKITPLSTFLRGGEVGRRQAGGGSRTEGLGAGLGILQAALPEDPDDRN